MPLLYIALSNGSTYQIEVERPEALADEIMSREADYEWLETDDDHWIRVEAIDDMWC